MVTIVDKILVKLEASTKALEKGIANVLNLLLGLGLSMLFAGMAIGRFFQTILRNLFETFLAAEGANGALNERVNELKATFAFLKFSIIDAFADSELIDKWNERLERAISLVNGLSSEQKATLVDFAINALLVGKAMMVLGQALLFLLGPIALIKFLGIDLLGVFAVLGRALFLNPLGLFLIFFLAIINILKSRTDTWGQAFQAFGLATLQVLAFIGDAIIELLVAPIRLFIAGINLAIRASNKLLGTNFKLIEQAKAFQLSRNVAGRVEDFQTGIRESRQVTNNITIEGNADEGIIDTLLSKLEEKFLMQGGSPQQ